MRLSPNHDYVTYRYAGLLELESSLPTELTNPRIVRPPKHPRSRGGRGHAEDRYVVGYSLRLLFSLPFCSVLVCFALFCSVLFLFCSVLFCSLLALVLGVLVVAGIRLTDS